MTAPTKFTITAGNGSQVSVGDTVTLTWSGATGTISDWEIQRKTDGDWFSIAVLRNLSASGSGEFSEQYYGESGNSLQYRIRSLNGSTASAWKSSNILQVLGSIKIKVNGSWKSGQAWIKINGTWKKAKTVWIKQNGTWKSSK